MRNQMVLKTVKTGLLAAGLTAAFAGGCASQPGYDVQLVARDAQSAQAEAEALNDMSLAASDALGRQLFVEGSAQANIFRKAGDAFAAAEREEALRKALPGLPVGALPETGLANVPTTPKD